MNKVNVHRYNANYNIIQKYVIDFNNLFKVLGYDVATSEGKFLKSFVKLDEAIAWLEAQ